MTTTSTQTGPGSGVDWTHELAEQLDFHWQKFARAKLEGLTDDEYFWEPVPGCWSLRARDASSTSHAAGAGDLVLDFAVPEPDPPPLTTIAWRLAHLAVGVLGARAASHFGAPPIAYDSAVYPATAAGALTWIDEMYDRWMRGVRGLDAAALARPCGPAEGPYAEYPLATLVLHINREMLHHTAEVLLLRDLYRSTGQPAHRPEGER